MARRGKKPEDYGQLALFEEQEPEWLKPVDQLEYTLNPYDNPAHDPAFDPHVDAKRDDACTAVDFAEDDDELGHFVEWLHRQKS